MTETRKSGAQGPERPEVIGTCVRRVLPSEDGRHESGRNDMSTRTELLLLNSKNTTCLTRLMSSRLYPGIFQWTVLALLLFGAWAALFTTFVPEDNFTLVFIWIFWGTVAPISMVLFGRYWCAMCPFHLLGNFLSRKFGKTRPIPRFFRHYGFWGALILFVAIVWFEHAVDIFSSTILTLLLLVPVLIGTVVGALAFRNIEWWCHGLCPLLPIARNYSMLSSLEVRSTVPSTCSQCTTKTCYHDAEDTYGCPVGLYPRTLDNMQECIACGECFKSCPIPGTIQGRFRNMLGEFKRFRPRMDAAVFAAIWPGLLAIHFWVLLPEGDRVMQ